MQKVDAIVVVVSRPGTQFSSRSERGLLLRGRGYFHIRRRMVGFAWSDVGNFVPFDREDTELFEFCEERFHDGSHGEKVMLA